MSKPLAQTLTAEKGLIFRITHRDNVPWILQNGLHCSQSAVKDPVFVRIGNPELITKRRSRRVRVPPYATLADYVSFYFTPFSPMLYNIKTGYGGIQHFPNEEIVILVSSLEKLEVSGVKYVFTDRHAYLAAAQFFGHHSKLQNVDFPLLQRRDFSRSEDDPGKVERYQAEALAYEYVPVEALLGLTCYDDSVKETVDKAAQILSNPLRIEVKPGWYF